MMLLRSPAEEPAMLTFEPSLFLVEAELLHLASSLTSESAADLPPSGPCSVPDITSKLKADELKPQSAKMQCGYGGSMVMVNYS
jgi:hypothetical protein